MTFEIFGYLTKFVITSYHPTKANQTLWLHNPASTIYNRHIVMESAKSKIRAHETATNVLVNMDRHRRAPIENRSITQEVLYRATTLTALEALWELITVARGYEGQLHKQNMLGTKNYRILATLDTASVIEPARDIKKQFVVSLVFFIWNQEWVVA